MAVVVAFFQIKIMWLEVSIMRKGLLQYLLVFLLDLAVIICIHELIEYYLL